jgi:hypothetical protein
MTGEWKVRDWDRFRRKCKEDNKWPRKRNSICKIKKERKKERKTD